ncbi:MAG: amidohydrolase family protein [Halieaceae bacterium]|jgi:cytosine/adenosine deaminase-related metal-dependent hydrolase|nr:amidohydrolase family protein [Halieaceae bacterium]
MSDTLICGAHVWQHGDVEMRIVGNRIAEIGSGLTRNADTQVINATGQLLYPGLVNTHHHIAQSLFKAMPGGINSALGEWLAAVPYTVWPLLTPDSLYLAARIGFAELLRAGCTLCADHHYLYHADTSPALEEAVFQAAEELGIRLMLCRGGNTVAGTHKGFRSTNLTPETLEQSIKRLQDTLAARHDTAPDAMTRVAVAPTALMHSHSPDHLKALAAFARENKLKRHTHLLEVSHDNDVAMAAHGMTAMEYAESVEWLGDDVWYAHLVHCSPADIQRLADTGTGIAHCPTSNCRLGSGVAPVPAMAAAGVPVSLGVDGSASAESGSLVSEMNLAWLVHRAVQGPDATDADTVVHWATRGGAELLGFTETGSLQVGMLADLVLYDLGQPRFEGVWDKPLAPVYCGEPLTATAVMVNGRWRVQDGEVLGLDDTALQRDAAAELARLKAQVA